MFDDISEFVSTYNLGSFNEPESVKSYVDYFGLEQLLASMDCNDDSIDSQEKDLGSHLFEIVPTEYKPFEPKYDDLVRLHCLILKRKVLTTLEFGSGYSTAIMAHAKSILSDNFINDVGQFRVDVPFHVYAVEEDQRFLDVTQDRLKKSELESYATISRSSVDMILHDNRVASVYSRLPNISPDFIYLDGPSQYATTTDINGINFNSPCRMPMSADILRFEFFLEPGTLIVVDGRTANARFLRSYLKRNWDYVHDPVGDVHYFELVESPLGKHNKAKIDFCLGSSFYGKN